MLEGIPLEYASLLDQEHLMRMDSVVLEVSYETSDGTTFDGTFYCFVEGVKHEYPRRVEFQCEDETKIVVEDGSVQLHTEHAVEGVVNVCGDAICNTLAVSHDEEGFLEGLQTKAAEYMESFSDYLEEGSQRRKLGKACLRLRR